MNIVIGGIWILLTIVYMVIFYAWFNNNYRMTTFGGIGDRAEAHFDNLITVGIGSFFLAAVTIYFFKWLLTSYIFWGIVGLIVIYLVFFNENKLEKRYKEFYDDESGKYECRIITHTRKDGSKHQTVFFINKERMYYDEETGRANAQTVIFHLKKADDPSSVDEMKYREVYFEKMEDNTWEYFFMVAADEKQFKPEDHEFKEFTNFYKDLDNWYKGPKSESGRNQIATYGYKFDPKSTETYSFIYRWIKENYVKSEE